MGEGLKKFGRYFLLDQIAQGGMAEIYRARLASADGAGRLMVIKRIQAGYGANAEFLQMFKSEIKVTMGFNHPNIVQLYDFGEEQQQPYIAMELVDGKSLRQFMQRFSENKQTFPVELATHIIEQAASGLHYAHSFKDKISGEPLNIVHRDISPQNILISFEGNVKVIDFGIAKATTNVESTRAGVIKGKPSYLSPEQISGETLDGRSDIFALGAVLWEILTGKKLFAGENDLAVLKLIESCQTYVKPPSTLNPKIPKELDTIVLKTLTKQRENRFQTAEELQRALHKFLYAFSPEFNPSDLSYYAKDLFKGEIVEDRKLIQKLNDKVENLLAIDSQYTLESSSESSSSSNSKDEMTLVDGHRMQKDSPRGTQEFSLENLKADLSSKVEVEATPKFTPRSTEFQRRTGATERGTYTSKLNLQNIPQQRVSHSKKQPINPFKMILMASTALVLISIFGPEFGIKVPIISDILGDWIGGSEARLVLQGNQKEVTVTINGKKVANSLPATINGINVGTPFQVSVTGTAGTFEQEITLEKGEKKTIPVIFSMEKSMASTEAVQAGQKSILLKLNLTPGGGSPLISLNGKKINPENPSIYAPLDTPLELLIQRSNFKTFKREFNLDSNQMSGLKEWLMDIQLEPASFGFLSLHTTPSSDAMIPFDGGTPWKRKTPLENEKLPVGLYTIRLTNEVLGMEKTIQVRIEEGKSINMDEIGRAHV